MLFNYFKSHFSHKRSHKLLQILLGLDLLFIITHVVLIYVVYLRIEIDWSIVPFMIQNDGSYPEIFQYLKYFMVVLISGILVFKRKEVGYISWLFIFLLLLLDDALLFHEHFGEWAAHNLNYSEMLGLRAQDLGELTYIAVFGAIILFFLALGYLKGNDNFRKTNLDIGLLFGAFLFCGIVIDMLHQFIPYNRWTNLFVIILEDGGEMITLTFIVWYFYYIILRPNDQSTFLYHYFIKRK